MAFTNALLLGAASQGSFISFGGMSGDNETKIDSTVTILNDPLNLFAPAINSGTVMSGVPFREEGNYQFILRQQYSSVSGDVTGSYGFVDLAILRIQNSDQAAGDQAGVFVDSPINLYIGSTARWEDVGFSVPDVTGSPGAYGIWLTMRCHTQPDVGSVSGTAIIEIRKIG